MTQPSATRVGVADAVPDPGWGGGQRATCWTVATAGPGSAGATTLALAVATAARALLVEADSDGGVLGLRLGAWLYRAAPSVATLLASLGPDARPDVYAHTQRLPSGVRAVLLPVIAEDAVGPVAHLVAALPALRELLPGGQLVLDAGRLRPGSSAMGLAVGSDVCVLVASATVEGLGCLLQRLPALAALLPRLVVAVRGEGPYRPADIRYEVAEAAGRPTPVVFIGTDPRGVAALSRDGHGYRGNRARTALLQATANVIQAAQRIQGSLHDPAAPAPAAGPARDMRPPLSPSSGAALQNVPVALQHLEVDLGRVGPFDPMPERSRHGTSDEETWASDARPGGGPW